MSRAAMMASASTAVVLASCSAYGQGPYCGDTVQLSSPCGLFLPTSDCADASVNCTPFGANRECTIGPIASDCTIAVRLGDGTQQTVDVTVQPAPGSCPNAKVIVTGSPSHELTSPTCSFPEPEAGTDAPAADADD